MSSDDDFRERMEEASKLLKRTINLKKFLDEELTNTVKYVNTLTEEGIGVSSARRLLKEARSRYDKSKGLTDYRAAYNILQKAKNSAESADSKVQQVISTLEESMERIKHYSEMDLDMRPPLKMAVIARRKLKEREYQTALLYASQAWNLIEEIHQKYDQIVDYRDECFRRYEKCGELGIDTDEMPALITEINENIDGNQLKKAYEVIERLIGLLDAQQGEYINEQIQDAYYEISRQPDIAFTDVQETLSQSEYALTNGDYQTAMVLVEKAKPTLDDVIRRYRKTQKKIDKVSTQVFQAKNLGIDVFQAEALLDEADRMLQSSDFRMSEEYARQAEMELETWSTEIDRRQRAGMENMEHSVRNSLSMLSTEIRTEKERGVDTEDAEDLMNRILDMMDDAKTIDDYKKVQKYISPTHSALSRARARFQRKEREEKQGRRELDKIKSRLNSFESVCYIPGEIREYLEKAYESYGKGNHVEMTRNIGQIEQFFREMKSKEADVDVDVELQAERTGEDVWIPAKVTIANNSNPSIRNVTLKMEGVAGTRGIQRVKEIKGRDSATQNIDIKFTEVGQNRVKLITKGKKAIGKGVFKVIEKTNIFVGERELLGDDYIETGSVDWF